MTTLWHDLRYGLRILGRNPGFTAAVVLVLTLGIGANTAVFTMTRSVLLSPLPFDAPHRVVLLNNESKKTGNRFSCSGPEYLDWAEQSTVFERISALVPGRLSLTGAGDPLALRVLRVTPDFFATLGVQPALGRGFHGQEAETIAQPVVVLSHRLWKNAFGGDPSVVGRAIMLDRVPAIVVGVVEPTMGFIDDMAQLYTVLPREELQVGRTNRYLAVFGRLNSGVSINQAQTQMDLVADRLAQEYPDSNRDIRIRVSSLHGLLTTLVRSALLVLHGAVALLLLIACANVSNLLLARSGARAREIAVRHALGAGRGRVLRQMLTESLLLALLGGGLGVILAFCGLDILKHIAPRLAATGGSIPGFAEIHLDSAVLGFTVALSVVTALVFGLIPAWRISGYRFRGVLSECGYHFSAGRSRQRTLGMLVISQVSLALVLLTGSGLLVRSFARLATVNPGFVPRGLLAVQMERPDTEDNRDSARCAAFYRQLVNRLEGLPGIESACAVSLHPMGPGNYRTSFGIGNGIPAGERSVNGEYRMVTSDFLRCMRIPLLKGRFFTPSDRATGAPVAVVNREFVRRSLWGEEAVGKSIIFQGVPRIVVGVVGNVKAFSLDERDAEPTVYEPIHQNCPRGVTVLVRTARQPARLASVVRRAVWEIDPDQPILHVQTMDQVVSDSTSMQWFSMILFAVMGGVALLMAVAGIYALVAYALNDRAREIGIRIALGAEGKDILRLAMQRGAGLAIVGLIVGLVGAFCLTRCMSGLLFEISVTDPVTFVFVPVLLLTTALLACYIPARRAARIDPMEALRYE